MTIRDKFFQAMQGLPGFILDTECDLSSAIDWITDQCGWCYLTNAEFNLVSEVFDECATWSTVHLIHYRTSAVVFLRSQTTQPNTNQMTFDRAQVIEDYIQQLIESMDYKTMECFVYDTLMENLTDYSDEQLIAEVTEYDPELLKDVTVW